jgi:hypothetical protein
MSDHIEFSELMASASSPGGGLTLANALRTEYIDSDPDDVATTTGEEGGRLTITSNGQPMTVRQVQAELDILVTGE